MIFAIETEEQTLHVFENENAAVGFCEGLDVEAAIWLFWNAEGSPLEPEFTVPNKRGLFTVQNGKYHLVKASENHHSSLLEALEHVVTVEGLPPLHTVAAIRQCLTHYSSMAPNGAPLGIPMKDIFTLKWLVGDVITQINFDKESNRWSILFMSGCILVVDCLWRLRFDKSIVSTSLDHGQRFGLASPFDAIASLEQQIGMTPISAINVGHMVTDLEIHFGSDIVFEVIQNSAGYEAWQACTPSGERVIALGSGELCT